LIKWKNKSLDDVTWEDNDVIKGQFPEFCLEDKAQVKEGGIDRDAINVVGLDQGPGPRVWKVYTRKRTKAAKGII
jgi:precorrin-4 methylase